MRPVAASDLVVVAVFVDHQHHIPWQQDSRQQSHLAFASCPTVRTYHDYTARVAVRVREGKKIFTYGGKEKVMYA